MTFWNHAICVAVNHIVGQCHVFRLACCSLFHQEAVLLLSRRVLQEYLRWEMQTGSERGDSHLLMLTFGFSLATAFVVRIENRCLSHVSNPEGAWILIFRSDFDPYLISSSYSFSPKPIVVRNQISTDNVFVVSGGWWETWENLPNAAIKDPLLFRSFLNLSLNTLFLDLQKNNSCPYLVFRG